MLNLLSVDQISPSILEDIFNSTIKFKAGEYQKNLTDKIVAHLFFEPSTRTRLSFEAATLRLGGSVITINDPKSSSNSKGESLRDTVETVSKYADVIILRHSYYQEAIKATQNCGIPVINAGFGAESHPTQAILDYCTMRLLKPAIGKVLIVGDIEKARTIKCLKKLLLSLGIEVKQVDLSVLGASEEYLKTELPNTDFVYITRFQKERYKKIGRFWNTTKTWVFNNDFDLSDHILPHTFILHPGPIVDEVSDKLRQHPGWSYLFQAEIGLYTRMALLQQVL